MTDPPAPRVFGPGDVTVCASLDGVRVYAGPDELGRVRRVSLSAGGGPPELEIEFEASSDAEASREIEESVRTAKSIPWIRVL